jgi:hypothetical protein
MTSITSHIRKLPIEDLVDRMSRLTLVLLLLATLVCLI